VTNFPYRTPTTSFGKTSKFRSPIATVNRWSRRRSRTSLPLPTTPCLYARLSQRVRPGLVESTTWRSLQRVRFLY